MGCRSKQNSQQESQMVEKHLRRCSTSLAITEMALRYHLTPVRMAKIRNNWKGCGARGALLRRWWECKLVSRFGSQCGGSSENWELTYRKPPLYHSWAFIQRTLHPTTETLAQHIHYCSVHNSQKLETT